jgi:hypothetical protein
VVADVFGLEDAEMRLDAVDTQRIDVPLVASDGAGAAWFDVMSQRAEIADVQPAAIGSAFTPDLSHGVVQVEPVHEEAD